MTKLVMLFLGALFSVNSAFAADCYVNSSEPKVIVMFDGENISSVDGKIYDVSEVASDGFATFRGKGTILVFDAENITINGEIFSSSCTEDDIRDYNEAAPIQGTITFINEFYGHGGGAYASSIISALCNKKTTCSMIITDELMNYDPSTSLMNNVPGLLQIRYHCGNPRAFIDAMVLTGEEMRLSCL
ncbi:hypothetical protein [uncultured Devosia sp.]|uniref:hypothetical protein n=1 Tax=uncultured Devosia sp. TaxID=211434 RepID=UPI0035CA866F